MYKIGQWESARFISLRIQIWVFMLCCLHCLFRKPKNVERPSVTTILYWLLVRSKILFCDQNLQWRKRNIVLLLPDVTETFIEALLIFGSPNQFGAFLVILPCFTGNESFQDSVASGICMIADDLN